MSIIALLGAKALWLTYAWLLAAILGSYLSGRKGYGERVGLACGLLLNLLGPLIWLFVPAKADSLWKRVGPWGTRLKENPAASGGSGAGESGARQA
jgi:hypothetical protein